MLLTLTKCQECNKPLASGCMHHPLYDQTLIHENDNSQEGGKVTIEELSKVSGLDENTLLHRLAAVLSERNNDLMSIIDVTRPAV